jgi:hypothetical protein
MSGQQHARQSFTALNIRDNPVMEKTISLLVQDLSGAGIRFLNKEPHYNKVHLGKSIQPFNHN